LIVWHYGSARRHSHVPVTEGENAYYTVIGSLVNKTSDSQILVHNPCCHIEPWESSSILWCSCSLSCM